MLDPPIWNEWTRTPCCFCKLLLGRLCYWKRLSFLRISIISHSTYPFSFILFHMLNRLGRNLCFSHIDGCIGLQRSIPIQRRCVSTLSSPFRIGEHLGNIENKGSPFVLIETSFLTKCGLFVPLWPIVSKPSSSLKALRYIENTVRKNGAVPVSLGMIDGEVSCLFHSISP